MVAAVPADGAGEDRGEDPGRAAGPGEGNRAGGGVFGGGGCGVRDRVDAVASTAGSICTDGREARPRPRRCASARSARHGRRVGAKPNPADGFAVGGKKHGPIMNYPTTVDHPRLFALLAPRLDIWTVIVIAARPMFECSAAALGYRIAGRLCRSRCDVVTADDVYVAVRHNSARALGRLPSVAHLIANNGVFRSFAPWRWLRSDDARSSKPPSRIRRRQSRRPDRALRPVRRPCGRLLRIGAGVAAPIARITREAGPFREPALRPQTLREGLSLPISNSGETLIICGSSGRSDRSIARPASAPPKPPRIVPSVLSPRPAMVLPSSPPAIAPTIVPPSPSLHFWLRAVAAIALVVAAIGAALVIIAAAVVVTAIAAVVAALRHGGRGGNNRGGGHRERGADDAQFLQHGSSPLPSLKTVGGGVPSMETFCPIRFEPMLNAPVIRALRQLPLARAAAAAMRGAMRPKRLILMLLLALATSWSGPDSARFWATGRISRQCACR